MVVKKKVVVKKTHQKVSKKVGVKIKKKIGAGNAKKKPWYMVNIGQNKLWIKAHSYKRLISIFEEVASELLFGLGVNRPKWN